MSGVQFANFSSPAAFAVEWSAGENGSRCQLVNPRGTASLIFGMKVKDSGEWMTTAVVDPTRFLDAVPRTFADFLKAAHAYVA
ncbi:hypothetical protein ACQPW3_36355 [Actinosynnema sp. CA-248983]